MAGAPLFTSFGGHSGHGPAVCSVVRPWRVFTSLPCPRPSTFDVAQLAVGRFTVQFSRSTPKGPTSWQGPTVPGARGCAIAGPVTPLSDPSASHLDPKWNHQAGDGQLCHTSCMGGDARSLIGQIACGQGRFGRCFDRSPALPPAGHLECVRSWRCRPSRFSFRGPTKTRLSARLPDAAVEPDLVFHRSESRN